MVVALVVQWLMMNRSKAVMDLAEVLPNQRRRKA
jgi:hypothetical protein